jgi:hypothetical protein
MEIEDDKATFKGRLELSKLFEFGGMIHRE